MCSRQAVLSGIVPLCFCTLPHDAGENTLQPSAAPPRLRTSRPPSHLCYRWLRLFKGRESLTSEGRQHLCFQRLATHNCHLHRCWMNKWTHDKTKSLWIKEGEIILKGGAASVWWTKDFHSAKWGVSEPAGSSRWWLGPEAERGSRLRESLQLRQCDKRKKEEAVNEFKGEKCNAVTAAHSLRQRWSINPRTLVFFCIQSVACRGKRCFYVWKCSDSQKQHR